MKYLQLFKPLEVNMPTNTLDQFESTIFRAKRSSKIKSQLAAVTSINFCLTNLASQNTTSTDGCEKVAQIVCATIADILACIDYSRGAEFESLNNFKEYVKKNKMRFSYHTSTASSYQEAIAVVILENQNLILSAQSNNTFETQEHLMEVCEHLMKTLTLLPHFA